MASESGLFLRAIALLACVCAALAADAQLAPAYSTYMGSGAVLQSEQDQPEFTSIRFDGSTMERQTVVKDSQGYDFIGIDGKAVITQDGAPALPHVTRFYRSRDRRRGPCGSLQRL